MANSLLNFYSLIAHSDESIQIVNDTGGDILAGAVVHFDDGTVKHALVAHHAIENGRPGTLHFVKKKRVYQAPITAGTAIAVGTLGSISATGKWASGTAGQGKWIALPKHGGGLALAAANGAATTTDDSVLITEA